MVFVIKLCIQERQVLKVNSTYEALADPKENVVTWGSAHMFSYVHIFSELPFFWRWNMKYKYQHDTNITNSQNKTRNIYSEIPSFEINLWRLTNRKKKKWSLLTLQQDYVRKWIFVQEKKTVKISRKMMLQMM